MSHHLEEKTFIYQYKETIMILISILIATLWINSSITKLVDEIRSELNSFKLEMRQQFKEMRYTLRTEFTDFNNEMKLKSINLDQESTLIVGQLLNIEEELSIIKKDLLIIKNYYKYKGQ